MMSSGYLIYHPKRETRKFGKTAVYFDKTKGNQDPYVWNIRFLHTFCHITEMSPEKGHICFWVSRGSNPKSPQLFCDLVFVVTSKKYWQHANKISRRNAIVDSDEAWNDHYRWGNLNEGQHHYFKGRRRFTLKADSKRSFQPQDKNGALIDIAPFLHKSCCFTNKQLWNKGARPLRMECNAQNLYGWICKQATTKLYGEELRVIRMKNSSLASSNERRGCCRSRQTSL
jgi:hypothetical protein